MNAIWSSLYYTQKYVPLSRQLESDSSPLLEDAVENSLTIFKHQVIAKQAFSLDIDEV